MKTLMLSSNNIKSIIKQVGIDEFMDASINNIENYFLYLGKKYERRQRIGFFFRNGRTVESMPCRKIGSKILFKTVNFHETNCLRGLPTVMSSTILCDEKTGFQEVITDSTLLTYIRTGAATAIATKYLARKESSKVGVIGAGSVGQACLHAISRIYNLTKIYIWDTDNNALETFRKRMEKIIKKPIEIEHPKKFVPDIDILTTTTYGNKKIVKNLWVPKGIHINAIGGDAPGKQELDGNILKRAKIVVDYKEQAITEGEINVPITKGIISIEDVHAELSDVVKKKKNSRKNSSEITLFDSTGDPLEDLAIIELLLKYNKRFNLGKKTNFIYSPSHTKDPYKDLR
ncbi:MAG: ornithine cyclodeaminase family protein [Candidatus Magasanikbacteria bacterium]